MNKLLLLILVLLTAGSTFARHNKGGTIMYTYLGAGTAANTSMYTVTVQHYINCERLGDEPNSIYLGIFDAATNSLVTTIIVSRSSVTEVQKKTFDACINPAPTICFYLAIYSTTITVTNNTAGYLLAEQECCRADGTVNISNPSNVGFTNTTTIPGIINGTVYRTNSSPVLSIKDTAVICHNSAFTIDFGATDPDGDQLTYTFCTSTASGSTNRQPNPPSAPPYSSVPYTAGYTAEAPLGSGVTINSTTGLISGIAPATTGPYIIAVCVNEFRDGLQIGTTKKEVLVTVADCSLTSAALNPTYTNCNNFKFTFQNESTTSNIASYTWNFGDTKSNSDVSTDPTPTYTYADTGTYKLKLKVVSTAGCSDSTTSTVKVYPGFTPDFTYAGSCFQSPFTFNDATYTRYGTINSRAWTFGETSSASNTAITQNTTHQYATPGTKTVTLTVGTSVGCSGVATKSVLVNDKPQIVLPFTDTLICSGDKLPLIVQGSGTVFSWTPLYNITNANTNNPTVYPTDTTVYTVTVSDKACVDSATITVNVLPFITVTLPIDTAICATDSIMLQPVSDALSYTWVESGTGGTLGSNTIKYPRAAPLQTTIYAVTANLGHCQDKAQTIVYVSPYPTAVLSADTSICYGATALLQATTAAANYTWAPTASLVNAGTLQPTAGPMATTTYTLTVTDTFYCPKPVTDTIIVTVIPPVLVNAGNDTSSVIGQPLQLLATANNENVAYAWLPAVYVSNANIANPVVTINTSTIDTITYYVTATTPQGCKGSDQLMVFIYKTLPSIFIPSGFTPNGDGNNDVFKLVLTGIVKLNFFRVYNRWGQLIYQTSQQGAGWNGSINGVMQQSGTYVYTAQGVDYTGKTLQQKGTVVLIR